MDLGLQAVGSELIGAPAEVAHSALLAFFPAIACLFEMLGLHLFDRVSKEEVR